MMVQLYNNLVKFYSSSSACLASSSDIGPIAAFSKSSDQFHSSLTQEVLTIPKVLMFKLWILYIGLQFFQISIQSAQCTIESHDSLVIRLNFLVHQRSFSHRFQTFKSQRKRLSREGSCDILFDDLAKILDRFTKHVAFALD